MKEKARLILESVIKQLDKDIRSSESGSWTAQAEKETKSGGDKTLREAYFALNVIMNGQQARDDAMAKILVGENILTPSLTNKGWQFWKQPLLTEKEKKAIGSAIVRWSEAKVSQANSLLEMYENLPNKDLHTQISFGASVLDIGSSCRQQLSADLKRILADSAED